MENFVSPFVLCISLGNSLYCIVAEVSSSFFPFRVAA